MGPNGEQCCRIIKDMEGQGLMFGRNSFGIYGNKNTVLYLKSRSGTEEEYGELSQLLDAIRVRREKNFLTSSERQTLVQLV